MNLTFYLIFYPLIKSIPLACRCRNSEKLLVEGPIYYKKERNCEGHVLLIRAEDLLAIPENDPVLKSSVFICFGQLPPTFCMTDIDLITADDSVTHEDVLNALQDIFHRFNAWESSMNEVIHENYGFTDLIDSCDDITDTPVALTDSNFTYIAYSRLSLDWGLVDQFVKNRVLPMEFVGMLISDPEYEKVNKVHNVFTHTLDTVTSHHINIFYKEDMVGRLSTICSDDPDAFEYQRDILFILSFFVEKLYARYRSFYLENSVFNSFHDILCRALAGQHTEKEQWSRILKDVGWADTDTYQLLQFRPSHRYDKTMYSKYLCPETEKRWHGSCCVEYGENIFLLLNKTQFQKHSRSDFQQELAYFLRDNLLAAGISRACEGIEHISAAHRQTDIAFETGSLKHPMFWYFRFDDYAFDHLLLHGTDGFTPEQICSEVLFKLKEHDEKVQTEYYKTLLTYLQCRYNAALTAKKLYIHRSTFLNRIDRIMELTHLDLDSLVVRSYLEISFLILERYSQ